MGEWRTHSVHRSGMPRGLLRRCFVSTLVLLVTASAAGCGGDERSASSASADASTGAPDLSPPDTEKISTSLDSLNEDQWSTAVNNSTILQLSWYMEQVAENPNVSVPTDGFTSKPSSPMVQDIDVAARQIGETRPSKQADLVLIVGPIATSSANTDPQNFSLLNRDTSGDAAGNSDLSVMYLWDEGGDRNDVQGTYLRIPLDDNYRFVTDEQGNVLVND